MSTIHTHGRVPAPLSGSPFTTSTAAEYPKCSLVSVWHCGRPSCVHPSYEDAQKHIDTDRTNQHERTK